MNIILTTKQRIALAVGLLLPIIICLLDNLISSFSSILQSIGGVYATLTLSIVICFVSLFTSKLSLRNKLLSCLGVVALLIIEVLVLGFILVLFTGIQETR